MLRCLHPWQKKEIISIPLLLHLRHKAEDDVCEAVAGDLDLYLIH